MTQWGLEAIFNPGKRFDDDERKRLQATREESGDASGGRRIDLGSGKVVIAKRDEHSASSSDPASSPAAASDGATSESAAKTTREEKMAAARAARAAVKAEEPDGRRLSRRAKRSR